MLYSTTCVCMSKQGRMYLLLYDKMKTLLIQIWETTFSAHWAWLSGACRRTTLCKVFLIIFILYLDHHLHHNNHPQLDPIWSNLIIKKKITVTKNPGLDDRIRCLQEGVHFETCPTSSILTGAQPLNIFYHAICRCLPFSQPLSCNSTFSLIDSFLAWHCHIVS